MSKIKCLFTTKLLYLTKSTHYTIFMYTYEQLFHNHNYVVCIKNDTTPIHLTLKG